MVEISRDGRRVDLTNSLYSPWDAQFYPDGIRMATAHGAGLMLMPFVTLVPRDAWAADASAGQHAPDMAGAGQAGDPGLLLAAALHTLSYLFVTGLVAVVVYEKVGLGLLRRAWINIDAIWIGVLVLTAVGTVLP